MDWRQLTNGQKIGLAAGVVLVINLFLPWYRVDLGAFGSASANAWDAEFWAWGGSLFGIAGAVVLAVKVFGDREVTVGNFKTEQIALMLGFVGIIFVLLRLITETSNMFIGLFLGLLGTAAVAFGSYMAMKEAGLELPSLDDFTSNAGGDEPPPPPPPEA